MNNDSSATDDNGMPPIPTFGFAKKEDREVKPSKSGKKESSSNESIEDKTHSTVKAESPDNLEPPVSKKTPKKNAAVHANVQAISHPVNFSTELRRSIQTDLAIISYHKGQTIKEILSEAFTLWLASPELSASQLQKKLKLMQLPENDPVDSFSNRISSDLKRQIAKLKFDREGINHPVKTIGAFTEEAMINWIPLQPGFSVEERIKRLSQKAA